MYVIEAMRTSILEPRDHLHIKHESKPKKLNRTPGQFGDRLNEGSADSTDLRGEADMPWPQDLVAIMHGAPIGESA
jgi:hypothetical protein